MNHEPDVRLLHRDRQRAWLALVAGILALCACASAPEGPEERPFFPGPPDPPRIQFLRSIEAAEDVEPPRSGIDTVLFGGDKQDRRLIRRPFGCAYKDGMVYVADNQGGAILRIDLKGRKVEPVPLQGRAAMQNPLSISFAPDGLVYVTDPERKQVVVLDKNFKWVAEIGPLGPKTRPVDVKVHGDLLYVADVGERCVWVLDRKSGEQRMKLGNPDKPEQILKGPTFVTVDPNGFAYVVDTIYSRITVWDKDGNYVRQIGEPGDIVGTLARPKGIAWSEDHTLYVLDGAFENCQIFDLDGKPLMFFGGPGSAPGTLYLPGTVWVGRGKEGLDLFQELIDPDFEAERLIIVTSQFGIRKVSFYAFGKSKNFKYPDVKFREVPEPKTPEPPKEEASVPDAPGATKK